MEELVAEISRLLNETLSPDEKLITSATEGLDRLSRLDGFPEALIAISVGGKTGGQRMAAATYLKNYTKRLMGRDDLPQEGHFKFRNQLPQALLQSEPAILKVLVEAFHFVVLKDFVEKNSWPELIPELKFIILKSLSAYPTGSEWNSINALEVLKSIVKPFQYFLNPKLPKEPVPVQLELITKEIIVPLQPSFCFLTDKVLLNRGHDMVHAYRIVLVICKCLYFTVRSYMPSSLIPVLPLFCRDLFRFLDSVDPSNKALGDADILRLKTGKRILIILSTLVTRHRRHSDKLMKNMIDLAFKIAKHSVSISRMDALSDRVVSLALDLISNVLETGPGWRLLSPHFSTLLESGIFPALVLNEKDISEWDEDHEEYMRKNHPSDLEISAWAEDLFTARKSAVNLIGMIALSKGPPMVCAASTKRKKGEKCKRKDKASSIGELLLLPFLSIFRLPSNAMDVQATYEYFGVLMAYGGLQDFLKERSPAYTTALIQRRILPIYSSPLQHPCLVTAANWVMGELASCLPQDINYEVYKSLAMALAIPDLDNRSCYPVRISSVCAIAQLLENDFLPLDWLPLMEILIKRMREVDESEVSVLFQLLCTVVEVGQQKVNTHIPMIVSSIVSILLEYLLPSHEPWPQVIERGFSSLSSLIDSWEDYSVLNADQEKTEEVRPGCLTIAASFSNLLQKAWLAPMQSNDTSNEENMPPSSCLDDASRLLGFILRVVQEMKDVSNLKVADLLMVWASLIAEYDAWEEMEDSKIFTAIMEVVLVHKKYDSENFFMMRTPSYPFSVIEGIGSFICKAFSAYPFAKRRACYSVHLLLHTPRFSMGSETTKQTLSLSFTRAAFPPFMHVSRKPTSLWKHLILALSSCYLCYPDQVQKTLQEIDGNGFTSWICALAQISQSSFEHGLVSKSELKLAVMALGKVVERLLFSGMVTGSEMVRNCLLSLMEASVKLKEVEEEEEEDEEEEDDDQDEDDDESIEDTDEDSDDEQREETEDEFLERYANAAATAVECEELDEADAEEDETEELDLGELCQVDVNREVLSLLQRHHTVLGRVALPPQLMAKILDIFPEYEPYFHPF